MAAKLCTSKSPSISPKIHRKHVSAKHIQADLGDSGIHLDEKTCPVWDYTAYAPNAIHSSSSSPVTAGVPQGARSPAAAPSEPTSPRQWSFSESDKPDPAHIRSSPCLHTAGKERKTSGGRAHFTIGPEDEGQGHTSGLHSGQKAHSKHEGHRSRLKKILRPLHRSHSAGSAKDLPGTAYTEKTMEGDKCENSVASTDGLESSDEESSHGSQGQQSEKKEMVNMRKKKTFKQDMKDKLSLFRRRHTDTALAAKMAEPKNKITAESLVLWSKSIDNLLNDPNGLDMFRDFLRTEFSDENLEFWIACQEYRQLKSSKIADRANKIYSDFVTIQAAREINLDSKTRLAVKDNMSCPNKHTFEEAQRKIQGLMEKDSYPRFLNSDAYQKLLRDHKVNT